VRRTRRLVVPHRRLPSLRIGTRRRCRRVRARAARRPRPRTATALLRASARPGLHRPMRPAGAALARRPQPPGCRPRPPPRVAAARQEPAHAPALDEQELSAGARSTPRRSCIREKQQPSSRYRVPCNSALAWRARPSPDALLLSPGCGRLRRRPRDACLGRPPRVFEDYDLTLAFADDCASLALAARDARGSSGATALVGQAAPLPPPQSRSAPSGGGRRRARSLLWSKRSRTLGKADRRRRCRRLRRRRGCCAGCWRVSGRWASICAGLAADRGETRIDGDSG
jgi:hypothetical protein